MKNEVSFLIADDHSIVREGIDFLLEETFENSKIFHAANFAEIIKSLNSSKIDLIILDVNFPDGNSLNYITTIRKIQPQVKILIFTGYDENIYAIRYLRAGANGYLSKLSSKEVLVNAFDTILKTGKYVSDNIQDKILNSFIQRKASNPVELLSNREIEIARLLLNRLSNHQIADSLKLQRTTVSTYKNRIFEKLEIESLTDLAQIFQLYEIEH